MFDDFSPSKPIIRRDYRGAPKITPENSGLERITRWRDGAPQVPAGHPDLKIKSKHRPPMFRSRLHGAPPTW